MLTLKAVVEEARRRKDNTIVKILAAGLRRSQQEEKDERETVVDEQGFSAPNCWEMAIQDVVSTHAERRYGTPNWKTRGLIIRYRTTIFDLLQSPIPCRYELAGDFL